MPAWVTEGFEDYARRMPREMPLSLLELKPATREKSVDTARWVQQEAERIRTALPRQALKVILDEHGRSFSTRKLAEYLEHWRNEGRDIAFVIGGADGLSADVKSEADLLWALSPLTLPHGLVRVLLAEQLYRASSILANHPYHRE